ncbi:MAG TPA: hypothetical protein ENJ00_05435 [Phycisphaerales bacterium]|nr:hypothetical protein [Phycisphaerales bacterium]
MDRTAHRWSANLLGLDYRAEAEKLGDPVVPIVDVHTHLNGPKSAEIWADVASRYGVCRTYSQTVLDEAPGVRDVLGDRVRFIAIPDYMAENKLHAFTEGFLERIRIWHDEYGARMLKFWQAPRLRDYMTDAQAMEALSLDGPWRIRALELAAELGMMVMTHIGDPDTWFAAKYSDASAYGTKADQYAPLERMLDRFPDTTWLAAHMGGWPEDLEFLSGLLERHDNLNLDTSACKWQVRELSRHSREDLLAFFRRWKGRVLFGSDIVARDAHLESSDDTAYAAGQASDPEQAFELYASRYWALRTLFETTYEGASPIADPDLMMVEPGRYDEMSSPMLRGKSLPEDVLSDLYAGAAARAVDPYYET